MRARKLPLVRVPIAIAILVMPLAVIMHAATVLYPFSGAGNAYAREPFALDECGVFTCRYQQVYDAARFSAILPDGATITQLLFVVDREFPRGFNADFPDIQIDFSVTTRGPDHLSTDFSENLGTNTVTVLPRGRLNMLSSGDPGTPIIINLPVAFFYDPTKGNLLLDIQKFARIPSPIPLDHPGVFEAQDTLSDSVSRVYAYDVNSPTGVVDTIGLTTIFKVTPPAIPRLLLFSSRTTGADPFLRLRWFRVPVQYTLEQGPALGSGASWQPFDGIVSSHEEYLEARVPVNRNDTARFFRLISQTSTNATGLHSNDGVVAVPFIEP